MPLQIKEIHRSSSPAALNEEWLVVENTGAAPVQLAGCTITVAQSAGARPRLVGALDPGFVLKPGEAMRLVTGSPARSDQGTPPDPATVRNYHLFLKEPLLGKAGSVVRLSLKQLELAKATVPAR